MEALSRDPDIVAISKDATHVRNQLSIAQFQWTWAFVRPFHPTLNMEELPFRLNFFYFIDKDDSEGITLDEFEDRT